MNIRTVTASAVLTATLFTTSVFSQNFVPDARRIALGAIGNQGNIGSKLAEEQGPYRAIPVPLGLFQVLRNLKVFDPSDANFDPVRAVENLASPMHFTFDRDTSRPGANLIRDLVNGRVSRDLNSYRGFHPASTVDSTGLWAPSWGKTIRVSGDKNVGSSHGIFVGAGPYVSLGTNLKIDQNLIDVLGSSTNVYRPNTTFTIGDLTTGQGAIAITGGYRGRFAAFGTTRTNSSSRDGVYIAMDYHNLRGVHYDTADLALRFDTDQAGQITLQPNTTPITVSRTSSNTGHGHAVDVGTAVIVNGWNFNVGVNGIGNKITWESLRSEQLVLQSLFQGGNFVRRPVAAPAGTREISLPVQYSGGGGYHSKRWAAQTELARGLQGFSAHNGVEYWLGPLALRAGSRYQMDRWHASTGIGVNLTRGLGIDLGAYQTTANIERKKKIALALSLRLNRPDDR
jgi:hypothetical protein